MDDITKKKINECVKRTLIYNSGRKLKRTVTFCSVQDVMLDNKCQGNINPDTAPGEGEAACERGVNNECFGCAFMKSYIYVSEALLGIKTRLALSYVGASYNGSVQTYSPSRSFSIATQFLINLLAVVRERCYLTFTNSMMNDAQNAVQHLSYVEVYQLISDIYDFCKENNIK